jgi:hypothetical protein
MRLVILLAATLVYGQPADIGSRLEPFVDDYLIDTLEGDAHLRLHRPEPREVVLITDEPWEGNTCAYYTIFRDGEVFRMYYRGSHFDERTRQAAHREVACYAESTDGIHWRKPALGLVEFSGSKKNNIIWDGIGRHNFTPFRDENPNCKPEARYKALGRGAGENRKTLYAFQSPDGIHWKLMSEWPVITRGAFDSQNLAFWDSERGRYVEFHRGFREGVRDIMTSTSPDFFHWTEPVYLSYPGAPNEHLYTNAVRPYPGAPHILIGFPTRFAPGTQQVEPIFMSSRDGRTFQRHVEPVIPHTAPSDRSGNRSNYMAWGLEELPGQPDEYSVYATEAYYTGPDSRLRRFVYRRDGFVSLSATQGTAVTKPIRASGSRMVINFRTAPGGSLRVGFAEQQVTLEGDEIAHTINLPAIESPFRIRFELRNADLFSIRFAR